jgi:predicted nucleic acid-binding protein
LKLFFDTNVLMAGLVESHVAHGRAYPWLEKVFADKAEGYCSTHSLAELYSIVTSIPHRPPITSQETKKSLDRVCQFFTLVPLGVNDYKEVVDWMVSLNIRGGGIYDALHARAALKAKADVLLTLNKKHFIRLGEAVAKLVKEP